jgi:predicted phage terminase large subunit-like protein
VRRGILTAVSDDAESRSAAIRRLVESHRFAEVFPWARAGVKGTPWNDAAWMVAGVDLGKDRTCTAMSIRSVRAGPRLDILLADDMVGMQENENATQRAKVVETYFSVVDPMLMPDGRRWFLGTRWHEDDIYAHLARSEWPLLQRRAIEDGEALWPDEWNLSRLTAKCLDMGSALFDLQYQNDPSGMGGNIFMRDWFRYVDTVPAGSRRVGVDLAASSSERSDYTAAVEVYEDGESNLYVVGIWRDRLVEGHRVWLSGIRDDGSYADVGPRLSVPVNALPAGFAGLQDTYPAARPLQSVNIEAVIFQSTFTREVLGKTRLPARSVHPDKDKVTRARTLAARYEAGKVYHLRSAPGLREFEAEMVAFPNAEHDDMVDAAVYAADLGGVKFSYAATRSF